jgi:hypothetical protein
MIQRLEGRFGIREDARQEARALLQRHWDRIECIAMALAQARILSGDEIDALKVRRQYEQH